MSQGHPDSFKSRATLQSGRETYTYYRLAALQEAGFKVARLPVSIRILLENLLRFEDGHSVSRQDIEALAGWQPQAGERSEIAFRPARVLLQDFTGVPAVVDLAAMREAIVGLGGDATAINPLQPVDLVIDHSVQVDRFGTPDALQYNEEREYKRNRERYTFLRWGQQAFDNFRVVPPGAGIVHQVNLEYLARVVFANSNSGRGAVTAPGRGDPAPTAVYPDSLVGTDSHTTMINGLGVLGWGVGGIEAEAAMLGQPISMLVPDVIGFKLEGSLPAGTTATDLVLTITEMLRKKGVVGKFVEFYGPGLKSLTLADRATIANMAPEYGATMGFFPVDHETLNYLRMSGRSEEQIQLIEDYLTEQGLFRADDAPEPEFTDTLEIDSGLVVASLAGPKRPQDRVPLTRAKREFRKVLIDLLEDETQSLDKDRLSTWVDEGGSLSEASFHPDHFGKLAQRAACETDGQKYELSHGSVVIAAITSCTNTSNPAVMIGAGLMAKRAVERGLTVKPWVKTSLAPGSKVVVEYLKKTGLLRYLEQLRFNLVGYGCTTCIGNSGPLPPEIAAVVEKEDLVAVSVLSGNRNFEGRINPHCKANYLASPPLVVAYALAGHMDIDLTTEALATDPAGKPVYLKDLWPHFAEIEDAMHSTITPELFRSEYAKIFEGDAQWRDLPIPAGATFAWDEDSTYVRSPPFFEGIPSEPEPLREVTGARCLALLGDSVTTDHISPAGAIPQDSPTADYLKENGVETKDFNSYGSRRGNHEVMMRGTFGNIRLRNLLAPGTEGGWTTYQPDGEQMAIYDAAMRYQKEGIPLVVLAGTEYGTGSSRDWAAKGTLLLGVKAVLAASFERIHRSNLVGMGVLPLQFKSGESVQSLGLTGHEIFSITGLSAGLKPRQLLTVTVQGESEQTFQVLCRIDTPDEVEYFRHGGILHYVLRNIAKR